jgi:polysaccharide export outer membrane protein
LKYFLFLFTLFLATPLLSFAEDQPKPAADALYKLSPGDVLEVSVWKEADLLKQVIIAPDGTISLPLVETIMAAGKTVTELKKIITEKLNSYIADPAVNVALIKNDGNIFFVIGKVNKPGPIIANRNIDVLQALSLAGGLTVFAKESSIYVQRRVGNEIKLFPFDYDDVLDGDNLNQNIVLQPGDTVTVR